MKSPQDYPSPGRAGASRQEPEERDRNNFPTSGVPTSGATGLAPPEAANPVTASAARPVPRVCDTVTLSPHHPVTLSRFALALLATLALLAFSLAPAWGIDQAKPDELSNPHAGMDMSPAADDAATAAAFAAQDRTAFEQNIKLDDFRLLVVQHLDQVKIIDSWARQSLYTIRHRYSLDGKDGLYITLDMALRPEAWMDKNIIYVESVPIRNELGHFTTPAEAKRIHDEALVSPSFLEQQSVQRRLEEIGLDARQLSAVNKVKGAYFTFRGLVMTLQLLPPTPDRRGTPWVFPGDIEQAEQLRAATPPATLPAELAALPPYTAEQRLKTAMAMAKLATGWRGNDVNMANQGLAELLALAPTIDPPAYPTATKRIAELWYNRAYSGTIVAFVYFVAMVLLLLVTLGAVAKAGRVWKTGVGFFAVALAFHVAVMGVRWWINGRIPIQNQFESVMGSACLGCILGLLLETRWFGKALGYVILPLGSAVLFATLAYWYLPVKMLLPWVGATALLVVALCVQMRFDLARAVEETLAKISPGTFGTAFAFVGFLATTIMLAAPYVLDTDLGASGGHVAGILMTGWLYIHVNIVIASYALITASAVIALIYLGLRQWHWVNPIEPGSEGAPDGNPGLSTAPSVGVVASSRTVQQAVTITRARAQVLEALDQANMVILQMAFWMLGVGILCGAVWADQSWGRPWGWDPKETFALVTWIVYLVIVHIRLVVKFKADTTAFLALAGCAVMLFNWIFVNFFLVGLHSYA